MTKILVAFRNYANSPIEETIHKTSQKNTHSKIEIIMKQVHKFQNYTTWPRHHMFLMLKNPLFSGLIDQSIGQNNASLSSVAFLN